MRKIDPDLQVGHLHCMLEHGQTFKTDTQLVFKAYRLITDVCNEILKHWWDYKPSLAKVNMDNSQPADF